ncbi:NEW3 domain-containing protein [Micromonospora sp. BRA006-A]|nr:NEW3 domain-containing protein [Micromonospora sp. BRA006-A]
MPAGWTVSGNGNVGTLTPGKEVVKTFTVTPPAQVEVGTRFKIDATLTSKKDGSGTSSARVQGTAPVRGTWSRWRRSPTSARGPCGTRPSSSTRSSSPC